MHRDERFVLPADVQHVDTKDAKRRLPVGVRSALKVALGVFVLSSALTFFPTISAYIAALRITSAPKEPIGGPTTANAASAIAASSSIVPTLDETRLPATRSDAETLLFQAVIAMRRGQLSAAETAVDLLLAKHPNYQLAHLVKADIYLARAGKLTAIGSGAASREQVAGLLRELEARVGKFAEPAIDGRRPEMFIQLAPHVRFALAVDVSRSRLYVLENAPMGPRRVFDVYATIGASGSGKVKEGDKRTPVGVYLIQSALDRKSLPDFYGEGAYPIDYPNVLDKREGRDGHGIWIHGVSKENFARPPRSSDGCIVVSNEDLRLLAPFIQPGKTQIAIADSVRWVPSAQVSSNEMALRKSLEQWRTDWESRQLDRYMEHYATDFFSDRVASRDAWAQDRRAVTEQKKTVSVKIENLTIAQVERADRPETVMVMFDQHYKSDAAETQLKKRQYWRRDGTRWKIVYEGNV